MSEQMTSDSSMPKLLKINGRWALEYALTSDVSHLIYLTSESQDRPLESSDLRPKERESVAERHRFVGVPLSGHVLQHRRGRFDRLVQQLLHILLKGHRGTVHANDR